MIITKVKKNAKGGETQAEGGEGQNVPQRVDERLPRPGFNT